MTRSRTVGITLVITIALLVGGVVPASGTSLEPPLSTSSEEIRFGVQNNGDVRLSLTMTYNLEDDIENESFHAVQENTTAQTAFYDQVSAAASALNRETSREMAVTRPETHTAKAASVGVVEMSLTWENLAKKEDEVLVLQDPFKDGFAKGRTVIIDSPSEYKISSALPSPQSMDSRYALWGTETDASGFSVTFESASGEIPDSQSHSGSPLFIGAVLILLGVIAGLVVLFKQDWFNEDESARENTES